MVDNEVTDLGIQCNLGTEPNTDDHDTIEKALKLVCGSDEIQN